MDAEMLHRLDDLRWDISSLHTPDSICTNLQQGYCHSVYRSENIFEYYLDKFHQYKQQVEDTLIIETLEHLEQCMASIATLNEQVVEIEAHFLGVPIPFDKRTKRYMERMARHRYEVDFLPYFFYEAHPQGYDKYQSVVEEAQQYQRIVNELKEKLIYRIDELIDGQPIPPRYYPVEAFEESEEDELPPFVQDIVYPYNSKPEFEYVDPPEPEPERDYSIEEWGDQRAKDFTRRAFHEHTEQAIRTLRGALRFGRTGPYANRAFSMLGELYERKGLYEKALEHYSLALSSIQQPYAHNYADRGRMYFRLGRWSEARADFTEALRWRLAREQWEMIQMCLSKIANQE
jgi:tetratricopeptide (TPR) repeat protein